MRPIIRFRKPMLEPLRYEGITRFSCHCRSFEHNVRTAFRELLVATLNLSPRLKHVDRSRRPLQLVVLASPSRIQMTSSPLTKIPNTSCQRTSSVTHCLA